MFHAVGTYTYFDVHTVKWNSFQDIQLTAFHIEAKVIYWKKIKCAAYFKS